MWKHIAIVSVVGIAVMYLLTPSSKLHTLKGKRVLVTGASAGIGEQIAYMYAKYGANVVVTARRQKELLKVTDKCATLSPSPEAKFYAVPSDMSLLNDTNRVIQESIELMGGLDILVLNHITAYGFAKYQGTQENLEDFDHKINVNFRSYVYLATYALNQLKANNGSIIVVNSIIGKMPMPCAASYSASKHALNGFFHSLASEMKTFGGNIAITSCLVGYTDTDSVKISMKKHVADSSSFVSPQTPEETAYDVVEAGARRVDRMFTPYFSGRLMTLVHELWPAPIECIFNNMVAAMKNLDP